MTDTSRPMFLRGNVELEDGNPPPDPAVIERVCGGLARPLGYTDSKGHFAFRPGQNASQMDADFDPVRAPRNFWANSDSERVLGGCEWRASLPGYSPEVLLAITSGSDISGLGLGTFVLRRYSSLAAPVPARKAFEKGRQAARKEKWAEASKQFRQAVGLYPQYAVAWCELGVMLERLKDTKGARSAYGRAIASDATFLKPRLQITEMAVSEQNWQELQAATGQIAKLDPTRYPGVLYLNAVAEYQLQNFEDAERSALEALKIDTKKQHPGVNHLLGVLLARKGELTAAMDYLRTYLELAPAASDAGHVKNRLAEIEKFVKSAPEVTR